MTTQKLVQTQTTLITLMVEALAVKAQEDLAVEALAVEAREDLAVEA